MDSLMARFGLFFVVLLLGFSALIVAVLRSKRRVQSTKSRSLMDYFLLWPLVFDQRARRERVAAGGRFFSTREFVGAAIFVVILVIGLALF